MPTFTMHRLFKREKPSASSEATSTPSGKPPTLFRPDIRQLATLSVHSTGSSSGLRSSSTLSDASSVLQTPVDAHTFPADSKTPKKRWWTIKRKNSAAPQSPASVQQQRPGLAPPMVKPPPRITRQSESSTDDVLSAETSDDDNDEDEEGPVQNVGVRATTSHRTLNQPKSAPVAITQDLARALNNLKSITVGSMNPYASAPPLVHTHGSSPRFPRSSNPIHQFPLSPSLCSQVHKKRLLKRIDSRRLTPAEQVSITSFSGRAAGNKRAPLHKPLEVETETMAESRDIRGGWSKGMKRWATRPCFEDRVVVWQPSATGQDVISAPVTRISLAGVPDLEFSEGAEALAGLHRQNELPPPPTDIYAPASQQQLPPPVVLPRRSLSLTGRRATVPPVDNGSDDDDLPLGLVAHRRRDERTKEKRLAEEKQRRERLAAEELKERERKRLQEEEQKKKYSQQLAAARERREFERQGKAVKDAWSEGVAHAQPSPAPRREPSSSSVSGRDSSSRRQTLPPPLPPGPWNDGSMVSGFPYSAPPTAPYPYGYPPLMDTSQLAQLALLEQNMRMWADQGQFGLQPPRFPSSGGSSGSLTPPRFPNSRPPSWSSSAEDVNARLSRPRSRTDDGKSTSRRSSRTPSMYETSKSQRGSKVDVSSRDQMERQSQTLPRSYSSRADSVSSSNHRAKATHDYTPSSSSLLSRPNTITHSQSSKSIETMHRNPRPHLPNSHSVPSQLRRSTADDFLEIKSVKSSRLNNSIPPSAHIPSQSSLKPVPRTPNARSSSSSLAVRPRTIVS